MSQPIHIFISCASPDIELGTKIYSSLKYSGHSSWIYAGNLQSGRDYWEQIDREMRNCTVALLLLSKAAYSTNDCKAEHAFLLERFKRREIIIIPIIAKYEDDFNPFDTFSRLTNIQFLDMSDDKEFDLKYSQLLRDINSDPQLHVRNESLENIHPNNLGQEKLVDKEEVSSSDNSIHTLLIRNLLSAGHFDVALKLVTSQLWVESCQALDRNRFDGYIVDLELVWSLIDKRLMERIHND